MATASQDYEIIKVEPWTALDANNNPYDAKRVTFRTRTGDVDHVIVPASTFSADSARAAIAKAAGEIIKLRT